MVVKLGDQLIEKVRALPPDRQQEVLQLIEKVRALPPDRQQKALRQLDILMSGRAHFITLTRTLFVALLHVAAILGASVSSWNGKIIPAVLTAAVSTLVLVLIGVLKRNQQWANSRSTHENRRPIWQVVEEVNTKLPVDTWENVPSDGSVNLDHYLYGAPKRPA